MTATSFSRRFHFYNRVIPWEKKEWRLSYVENRRTKKCMKKSLPAAVFFFSAAGQTRPCLKIGGMLDWGRFFRQARRFSAGILTDFKGNQRSPGGKRCLETAFWHFFKQGLIKKFFN